MVPKELDQAINAGKRVLPFCIDDYPLREDFGFYLSNVQRYEAWKDTEYAAQAMIRDIYGAPSTPSPPPKRDILKKVLIAAFAIVAIVILVFGIKNLLQGMSAGHSGNGGGASANAETNLLVTDSNSSKEDADGKNLVEGGASDSSSVKVASEAVVEGDKPEGIGSALSYNTKGRVHILHRRYAHETQFERLAVMFEQESGISVKVETSSSSSYSEALERNITGHTSDPTLFMLSGLRDFEKYGFECQELTDSVVTNELLEGDDSYMLRGQNGKIYGLACIVEAYGLCVNTRLLERVGYKISDIQTFDNLKDVAEDITGRKRELGFLRLLHLLSTLAYPEIIALLNMRLQFPCIMN